MNRLVLISDVASTRSTRFDIIYEAYCCCRLWHFEQYDLADHIFSRCTNDTNNNIVLMVIAMLNEDARFWMHIHMRNGQYNSNREEQEAQGREKERRNGHN